MKILNEKGLALYAGSGAPADKDGYLYKKGEVNKGFQKRWFVLKGNLLFYYEKKGDREPIGVIVLEGCTIELAENTDNFTFQIIFSPQGCRTYVISAETQEIMESWMKVLSCAAYDYVKLMVADLQNKLNELSTETVHSLIKEADCESKRLLHSHDSPLAGSLKTIKPPPYIEKRRNPFNSMKTMTLGSGARYFNVDESRAHTHQPDTPSTQSMIQPVPRTFLEMHEEIGNQVTAFTKDWNKKKAVALK